MNTEEKNKNEKLPSVQDVIRYLESIDQRKVVDDCIKHLKYKYISNRSIRKSKPKEIKVTKIGEADISKKKIYPKSVYRDANDRGFNVQFHSKKYNKTVAAGWKKTLDEAIELRNQFIRDNIDDLLEGYRPRGISINNYGYTAKINFAGNEFYLGYFLTLEEAVAARHDFLDSLK